MAFRRMYDTQQFGVPQYPSANGVGMLPPPQPMGGVPSMSSPVVNVQSPLRNKPSGIEPGGVLTYLDRTQGIAKLPPAKPAATFEVSPFLTNMYKSMQNIDPELRTDYVKNAMGTIKARLDKYEFRMARGLSLTSEQQTQYNNLQSSYNDLQKYINNPSVYDKHFGATTLETIPAPVYPQVRQKPLNSLPGSMF